MILTTCPHGCGSCLRPVSLRQLRFWFIVGCSAMQTNRKELSGSCCSLAALVSLMMMMMMMMKCVCFFLPSSVGAACLFRYNALSFVYLIYLLLLPLFPEPTSTTMQGKLAPHARLCFGFGFIRGISTHFPTSPCGTP